jgi:hypothetical protein
LNGDGYLDVAISNPGSSSVSTYAGEPGGAFQLAGETRFTTAPGAIAAGDLNGDKRADPVVAEPGTGLVSVLLGGEDSGLSPAPVSLISPPDGTVIPQNDPSTGCAPNPVNGSGFRLQFTWERPGSAAGIAGYALSVQREGAPLPFIEVAVSPTSDGFNGTFCGFMPDTELDGWYWRMRARDAIGNLGPWSEKRQFRLAPCRLQDGRSCGTPPPTPPPASSEVLRMSHAPSGHSAFTLQDHRLPYAHGQLAASLVGGELAPILRSEGITFALVSAL